MSYEERISDEQLDHLIRMQDMLRSRMAGVLASDDGFHEGNVHAGTYRALVELQRLRRELAEARYSLVLARDYIEANQGGWCRDGVGSGIILKRIDAFLAAKEGER